MPRRRNKAKQRQVSDIYSWTPEDTDLAGMPDPMSTHQEIAPPEIIAMFEHSFYTALAHDHEFWQEREARLVQPEDEAEYEIEEDIYAGDNLTHLLQDDMHIAGRALYIIGMSLVYLLLVMPVHIALWAYNTIRRYLT